MSKLSKSSTVPLEELVEQAKGGDKDVLAEIIRRIQDKIYGLAIRMLYIPADAEDAAQEILVKIITHLGTFKGESRFETWVYSIASNHLLTTRKCRAERWQMTFGKCIHMIEEGSMEKDREMVPAVVPALAEDKLVVKETKLACIHFLLLCLTREVRLAVILGEIFGVKGTEGAKILGLAPAAYRQRLSRGKKQLIDFLSRYCGLVTEGNPCHCATLATLHVKKRHIDPENLLFATHPCRTRRDSNDKELLKELDQMARAAMLIRSHPDYAAPGVLIASMKGLIDSGRFQLLGR